MNNKEVETSLMISNDSLVDIIHELAMSQQIDEDMMTRLMIVQYGMSKCIAHLSRNNDSEI